MRSGVASRTTSRQLHRQPDDARIDGLLKADLVEWVTAMTYQSASGAGAQNMRELLSQMGHAYASVRELLADPSSAILEIDRRVGAALLSEQLPKEHFGVPWPAASFRGSTKTWATASAARNGRAAPRPTKSSAGRRWGNRGRWSSRACAFASVRCAATARR